MFDANREGLTLGVVGTGLMGRGIAQIAVQGGVTVRLFDSRAGAAAEARDAVADMLAKLAAKGKIDAAAAQAATARLTVADSLPDLAGCDVVVEAIVENLDAKRALFRDLEDIVGDDCVLATNTSSLSVTAIAAACRRPERVGGFHFFRPGAADEGRRIIDGVRGDRAAGDSLVALARAWAIRRCAPRTRRAFIVNHAGRAYLTEALRVLGEGVTDFATLDRILRARRTFAWAVRAARSHRSRRVASVMESIYDQYYQEPRYRPSPITRQRLASGLLGRKSGRGFYTYSDGRAEVIAPPEVPTAPTTPLWISPRNAEAHATAVALLDAHGVIVDRGRRPADNSVCHRAAGRLRPTGAALAEGLDPARTLALDPLFPADI